ncbi:Asp23/Gls24 family envelope stress response protein [Mechercharimyces sp. CAU 1602]|uniref:Asp23/Gls24 family envelope stress response protein n=1 Tax=Mechercharimyces sp. CAU 1602 TaxID=2973933 RepID=UPI002161F249|nr:Asp23/Gls24 family envelope stress response protein [Mechercharimyces sp. CAU 1602]MCS1351284.1 Asp23/Gls24 family envelope stress response protein [Mechercharimyces sp. CAU 1602]
MATEQQQQGLTFSNEVLESIAELAATPIQGIRFRHGRELHTRYPANGNSKDVHVDVDDHDLTIYLKVGVDFGTNVPLLYERVSDAITEMVERMTGYTVLSVNMSVEEIHFSADDTINKVSTDNELHDGSYPFSPMTEGMQS